MGRVRVGPGGLPFAGGGEAVATTVLDLPPGEGENLIPGQGFVAQDITGPDGWLAGLRRRPAGRAAVRRRPGAVGKRAGAVGSRRRPGG